MGVNNNNKLSQQQQQQSCCDGTNLRQLVQQHLYRKQNHELELLRQGILTDLGDLKPDLEDADP